MMLLAVETCLRRLRLRLQRWLLGSRVRAGGQQLALAAAGFFLGGAGLEGVPMPAVPGLLCALEPRQLPAAALGAAAGLAFFWGSAAPGGLLWILAGAVLGVLRRRWDLQRERLLLPLLACAVTAAVGLGAALWQPPPLPFRQYLLQLLTAAASVWLLPRLFRSRDPLSDWLAGGAVCLVLGDRELLGFGLGAVLSLTGAYPAAVLAGLGLDLARVSPVSMGASLSLAWFCRWLPLGSRWLRSVLPAAGSLAAMALQGCWDPTPLPGLLLGGILGCLLPPRPEGLRRRGELGAAQVRLELAAGVMSRAQQLLLETEEFPIDTASLLRRVRERACGSCSARHACLEQEKLHPGLLTGEPEFFCRKPGRLLPELQRGREQLLSIRADRARQREYRSALLQQYRLLGVYLRELSDSLPARTGSGPGRFRVELSARSRSRERANGDRCMAFPGAGCRYYALLCDGMGTGAEAAREGQTAASLLRQMLTAGLRPSAAFRFLNSLQTLRSRGGTVTLDLAQLRLDTGGVVLYKWGAAPSWVLRRSGPEKIGTATPPPGLSVAEGRESVLRLSLRRGETLVLASDGLDAGAVLGRKDLPVDRPPGELAAWLLEQGCPGGEDDATVLVIRLYPRRLDVS